MIITRRRAVGAGGGFLAALLVGPTAATAGKFVEIAMQGDAGGSHVWFDPIGVHIRRGQTVRWINRDAGNSHTATAYHPKLFGRPLRIPAEAKPWDSDYLLPGEAFSATFTEEGVYDYYCMPHEHAGMVGRIVVGESTAIDASASAEKSGLKPLPPAALAGFPSVKEIVEKGFVRRS